MSAYENDVSAVDALRIWSDGTLDKSHHPRSEGIYPFTIRPHDPNSSVDPGEDSSDLRSCVSAGGEEAAFSHG